MARPSKFDELTVRRITDALRVGASLKHSAEGAGIAYETLRRWMRGRPAFELTVRQAEATGVVRALQKIDKAGERDWRAAAWMLEHRFPQEYGRAVARPGGAIEATVGVLQLEFVKTDWRADRGLTPDEAAAAG